MVIYSTLITLTVFLAVKKCVFVTMHGGSAVTFHFLMNQNFICTTVISQAENDLDAGVHFFEIRDVRLF